MVQVDEIAGLLDMLSEHGPLRLTTAADISLGQKLFDAGYIADHGESGAKKLTRKGRAYVRTINGGH